MNKYPYVFASIIFLIFIGIFVLSCDEKCTCPEEHIPEYHMTFCYVTTGEYPDNSIKYVVTYNTSTFDPIDSTGYYNEEPYRDICYFGDGKKALITNLENLYIEDVVSHDTLATAEFIGTGLHISSDEKYLTAYLSNKILSIPDLQIVDSLQDLWVIGINGTEESVFALEYAGSRCYSIKFTGSPVESTYIDIGDLVNDEVIPSYGHLTPDNKSLLIDYLGARGGFSLLILDAANLNRVDLIEGHWLNGPCWTSDGTICYGTDHGSVVKYNTQTNIYTVVIDKNEIISSDYWMEGTGFYASYVEITPDDKYLYIQLPPQCGEPCFGFNGSTLVYDIDSKDIIYRYKYSDEGLNIMRINPNDWSK